MNDETPERVEFGTPAEALAVAKALAVDPDAVEWRRVHQTRHDVDKKDAELVLLSASRAFADGTWKARYFVRGLDRRGRLLRVVFSVVRRGNRLRVHLASAMPE